MERLKVKNDFIFQKIFGQNEHKEILISFLNAVLALETDQQLADIEIMENTRLKKDSVDDKLGILDIRARAATGEQINIEIQLVNQYNMDQRTLFYWSKLLTDILEIHFLELPKFRKARPDLGKPLDRWLIFIEDSPEEVREMAMNNDPAIAKAEELLEHLGSLDEVKRYYEAREMAIHDEVTRITGARAEGRMEGEAEGILKGKLETAQNLLSMGMSIQNIATATGLAVEQIEQLQRNSRN